MKKIATLYANPQVAGLAVKRIADFFTRHRPNLPNMPSRLNRLKWAGPATQAGSATEAGNQMA